MNHGISRIKQKKISLREMKSSLKTSRDMQMLFPAVAHLDEGLSLEI
jgi:hypothetical protein